MANLHETQYFGRLEKEPENEAKRILMAVSNALREKGYNPVNQIVGYILSGDPTYITSYQNARVLIRKLERDELLEELRAQGVCDLLIRNGIKAIWNFAPTHLDVPPQILVQNENMATSLAVLSKHLSAQMKGY